MDHDRSFNPLLFVGILVGLPLAGCATQQAFETEISLEPTHPIQVYPDSPIDTPRSEFDSGSLLAELLLLLTSAYPQSEVVPEIQSALGPELVAGDWLAWQCALTGNYWDMPSITTQSID
jgi:hypothetical protein